MHLKIGQMITLGPCNTELTLEALKFWMQNLVYVMKTEHTAHCQTWQHLILWWKSNPSNIWMLNRWLIFSNFYRKRTVYSVYIHHFLPKSLRSNQKRSIHFHTISKCFNNWFTRLSYFFNISWFINFEFLILHWRLSPSHLLFLPLLPENSSLTCNLILYLWQISRKCLLEPFKCYHVMQEKEDANIVADFLGKYSQPICIWMTWSS